MIQETLSEVVLRLSSFTLGGSGRDSGGGKGCEKPPRGRGLLREHPDTVPSTA